MHFGLVRNVVMGVRPRGKNGNNKALVNCWDFYHCPRERQLVCPAFQKEAGRACWSVAGTLCGGEARGVNANKLGSCTICDFYRQVRAGEM
jgi:hypothetical protein